MQITTGTEQFEAQFRCCENNIKTTENMKWKYEMQMTATTPPVVLPRALYTRTLRGHKQWHHRSARSMYDDLHPGTTRCVANSGRTVSQNIIPTPKSQKKLGLLWTARKWSRRNATVPKVPQTGQPVKVLHVVCTEVSVEAGAARTCLPPPCAPPPPPQCTRREGRTRVNGSRLLAGRPPMPIPWAWVLRGPSIEGGWGGWHKAIEGGWGGWHKAIEGGWGGWHKAIEGGWGGWHKAIEGGWGGWHKAIEGGWGGWHKAIEGGWGVSLPCTLKALQTKPRVVLIRALFSRG